MERCAYGGWAYAVLEGVRGGGGREKRRDGEGHGGGAWLSGSGAGRRGALRGCVTCRRILRRRRRRAAGALERESAVWTESLWPEAGYERRRASCENSRARVVDSHGQARDRRKGLGVPVNVARVTSRLGRAVPPELRQVVGAQGEASNELGPWESHLGPGVLRRPAHSSFKPLLLASLSRPLSSRRRRRRRL